MATLISAGVVGIASTLIAVVCCTVVSRRGKFKEQEPTSAINRADNSKR